MVVDKYSLRLGYLYCHCAAYQDNWHAFQAASSIIELKIKATVPIKKYRQQNILIFVIVSPGICLKQNCYHKIVIVFIIFETKSKLKPCLGDFWATVV